MAIVTVSHGCPYKCLVACHGGLPERSRVRFRHGGRSRLSCRFGASKLQWPRSHQSPPESSSRRWTAPRPAAIVEKVPRIAVPIPWLDSMFLFPPAPTLAASRPLRHSEKLIDLTRSITRWTVVA